MMTYQLDVNAVKESFRFETRLFHNPQKRTRLLPYKTKMVFNDNRLNNFRETMGEFVRLVSGKKPTSEIDMNALLDKVLDHVETDDHAHRQKLRHLLQNLFFSNDQQLHLFHPNVMYYIRRSDDEAQRLAPFLYHVLWDSTKENQEFERDESIDVVTKLLFESLPELQDTDVAEKQAFHGLLPEISQLFSTDYAWLVKKPHLFVEHFEKLLSYYYFFYVSQLAFRCQAMFDHDGQKSKPLYFTLEWESLSQTRIGFEEGWKRLESVVSKIFAHVNCLEMLNHTQSNTGKVLSYQEIGELIGTLDDYERMSLEDQIQSLISEYQNTLHDVDWEGFSIKNLPYEDTLLNQIYRLYRIIEFQFERSDRNGPYKNYTKWFTHFCQSYFIKLRGRLGKTLKLNADYLLFFTKLIIKDEPKIRLKNLFDEFQKRGIVFDRDTQHAIIEYFDVINILEKKSDSGDALYVKAFL